MRYVALDGYNLDLRYYVWQDEDVIVNHPRLNIKSWYTPD